MEYWEAVDEVLDKAAAIKLPGQRIDVVTMARREFARHGTCDHKLIDPIEEILRTSLEEWSTEKKRKIWESTETDMQSDVPFDVIAIDSIDLELEGELMYHLIDELSPHEPGDDRWDDDPSETPAQPRGATA